jgi:hypothetical protein
MKKTTHYLLPSGDTVKSLDQCLGSSPRFLGGIGDEPDYYILDLRFKHGTESLYFKNKKARERFIKRHFSLSRIEDDNS